MRRRVHSRMGLEEANLTRPEPHSREPVYGSYAFGNFELDMHRRVLRRGGQELTLRPKSFDVLGYLIRQQGQLVTSAAVMAMVGFVAWRIWSAPKNPEPFRSVPLNSLPGV